MRNGAALGKVISLKQGLKTIFFLPKKDFDRIVRMVKARLSHHLTLKWLVGVRKKVRLNIYKKKKMETNNIDK